MTLGETYKAFTDKLETLVLAALTQGLGPQDVADDIDRVEDDIILNGNLFDSPVVINENGFRDRVEEALAEAVVSGLDIHEHGLMAIRQVKKDAVVNKRYDG